MLLFDVLPAAASVISDSRPNWFYVKYHDAQIYVNRHHRSISRAAAAERLRRRRAKLLTHKFRETKQRDHKVALARRPRPLICYAAASDKSRF